MYPIEVTIVGPPPGRSVWRERDRELQDGWAEDSLGRGLTRQGIQGVRQSMVFKKYILVCSDRM